jgi:HAE1 family hydrophobic/amphiphilic exporter-1
MNLVEASTRRRVTVAMFTITAVLFGLIGLQRLNVNLLPDLSYPTLTIRTELTGAAPAEIETLLSEPVEEVLGVVKNVRVVKSVSRTGQSDVTLEFAWGTDMDGAAQEVREKLELLQLPLEATRPLLLRFNPSTEPILRVALRAADGASAATPAPADAPATDAPAPADGARLADQVITAPRGSIDAPDRIDLLRSIRRHADDELQKRLEPIPGVAAVKISGGLEDEVQVEIDQQKLAQLRLDVNLVIERLRAENVNVSGGRLDEASQRFLVRTMNQFATTAQMQGLLITVIDGVPVKLEDIATVTQGWKEREAIIRVAGEEAVEIAIYKEGDANTVAVADAAQRALKRLESSLPPGTKLEVVDDQSRFIRSAISEVQFAALLGGLLSVLVIYCFLGDAWATLVISLSLPVSIIASFFLMQQLGISLNVMSLGGIALATGMVVDNAIVVLENAQRLRAQGMGATEAAIRGTTEVSMAISASTFTHVAVFLPLVFVEGIAGQLFRDQALTVSFAMLISLVVALTLIPMLATLREKAFDGFGHDTELAAKQARPPGRIGKLFALLLRPLVIVAVLLGRLLGLLLEPLKRLVVAGQDALAAFYDRILPAALARPALVLGIGVASLVGAGLLVPRLGLELIPEFAQGQLKLELKLPPGTPLAQTDAVVARIQREARGVEGIAQVYAVSGSGTRLDANPTESGENIGRFTIQLAPGVSREEEPRIINALREVTSTIPGADVRFSRPELFSFATPLEIEISGYELDQLKAASGRVAEQMRASPRFADVKSSLEQGAPELRIYFDQDKLASIGLTTRQAADQIVRKVRGEVATKYSFRDRKIDVLVRARAEDRASVQAVRELVVNPDSPNPLPLSAVARIELTEGPAEIRRADQERVAIVAANLAQGDLGSAVQELEAMLAAEPLAAGVMARVAGQSEEMDSSFQSLLFALALAIFLVYLVMASQFESLLHPFVILFTIPLALVGAVLALWVTASTVSIVVFIGLIMLVGIVVSNAIVLIDRVNQKRSEGLSKQAALLEAGRARLRPIVMTTVTTLIGFLPMALGIGEGAEVRAPMAITVIGGLTVSTVLTLVVIPVLYNLLDRRETLPARRATLLEAGA